MIKYNNITVSIVIPAYNESTTLEMLLEAISKQDYPMELIEVIIVDDHSKEPIANTIQINSSLNARIIRHEHNKGLAGARNTGIINAENQLIILLDSDIIPDTKTISNHVNTHINNNKNITIGTIKWHPDAKTNHFTRFARWFEFDNSLDKPTLNYDTFSAANLSVYKNQLIEQGVLFDENFSKYGLEDIEFAYRALKTGFEIKFHPEITGLHYRHADLKSQINRAKQSVESIRHFLEKHNCPDVFQKIKYIPPNILKAYKPYFDIMEQTAYQQISTIEKMSFPNIVFQEMYCACCIFLIEYAPYSGPINNIKVKIPDGYTMDYKTTAIDWAYKVNILDLIINHDADPDIIYKTIISQSPDKSTAQSLSHEAGRYYILNNQDDSALEMLNLSLQYDIPPSKEFYLSIYLISSILKRKGFIENAQLYFKYIVKEGVTYLHKSQVAGAFYHLGTISTELNNDISSAKTYFERALDYCPSHNAAKSALQSLEQSKGKTVSFAR